MEEAIGKTPIKSERNIVGKGREKIQITMIGSYDKREERKQNRNKRVQNFKEVSIFEGSLSQITKDPGSYTAVEERH